jgi:ABC-type molybdate transport system substrate-binding protein
VYPAAALGASTRLEDARGWLSWLQGAEGRAIAARYGFSAPPPAR